MTVVRGNDHLGFLPVAVLFHPLANRFESIVATEDRSDCVVNIVVVVGPVDIAGFDHQIETDFVLFQNRQRRRSHVRQGWVLTDVRF